MADTKEIKPFVQLSVQGATKTTELTDFPDDLTGQGGKVPRVKEDGTGFELALPAESHDMASPVGATYLVSDFRKLVAGEGYRLPLNSGTDYVNLTSVGLTNRPDAKSAFIEKISEHLYQLVINENTSNGEFHDIYYLTLGDVLDDSLGLGNTGTTFNKDKTVFDLTTKLNSLEKAETQQDLNYILLSNAITFKQNEVKNFTVGKGTYILSIAHNSGSQHHSYLCHAHTNFKYICHELGNDSNVFEVMCNDGKTIDIKMLATGTISASVSLCKIGL